MKILKFIPVVALSFALVACGSEEGTEGGDTANDTTATANTDAEANTPEVEPAAPSLAGEWKLDDIQMSSMDAMLEAMPEEQREATKAQMEAMFTAMKDNGMLTVNEDGTYSMTAVNPMSGAPETTTGSYALSDDMATITMTGPTGKAEIMNIDELTSDKVVMSPDANDPEMAEMGMSMTWVRNQ